MIRFSEAELFANNERTGIRHDRMSGDPVFSERIVIGIERSEFSGLAEAVGGPQMKMEKRSRVPLSGFMLMDVQVRRF